MKNIVIVITGSTASGKSSLGLALAEKLGGVIVSADSMQIYRKLDIGTAKATKEEMEKVPHYMIDICDVEEKYDVLAYKEKCYEVLDEVLAKGKVPIIVGGTGLYINAVVNNVEFPKTEIKNIALENEYNELVKTKTTEELWSALCELDMKKADTVDRKNRRRVERALYLAMQGKSGGCVENNLWKKRKSPYEFITIYIDMPRDLLYDRIEKRVDEMIDQGVLEEAKLVYEVPNKEECTAAQAIGYKEFFGYFDGTKPLEECVEQLKTNTRHYAKRQITWFKKLADKIVVDGTKPKAELVKEIEECYENKT